MNKETKSFIISPIIGGLVIILLTLVTATNNILTLLQNFLMGFGVVLIANIIPYLIWSDKK